MEKNKLTPSQIYGDSTIRTITVIFGSVFSKIYVRKYNKDGSINKTKQSLVPINYSAKDHYAIWLEQQMRNYPTGTTEVNTKLPRISFEMNGLQMAPERGINTNLPMFTKRISTEGTTLRSRSPISYAFDFTLSIWAKQMDDSIQILEQILPMFSPEISIKVTESKALGIVNDVKIVFNGVSKNDNYQAGLEENRFIEWDLSFSVYADILPDYKESTVISKVIVETAEEVTQAYVNGIMPEYMKPYEKTHYGEIAIEQRN